MAQYFGPSTEYKCVLFRFRYENHAVSWFTQMGRDIDSHIQSLPYYISLFHIQTVERITKNAPTGAAIGIIPFFQIEATDFTLITNHI